MSARRPKPLPEVPVDGLLGNTGSLTGHEVLSAVRGWVPSGTLALAQGHDVVGVRVLRGVALMALSEGEVKGRHMLGRFAGLAATGLDLHAVPHAPGPVPRLPSAAQGAELAVARALPRFATGLRLLPGVTDVKPLLGKLGEVGWHGALLGSSGTGCALAVLLDGRLVAASGHRGNANLERQDALRLLQRLAHENEPDVLQLVPLEPRSAAALAGYALGNEFRGEAQHHTGISVGPTGCTFVHRGEPYLTLADGVAEVEAGGGEPQATGGESRQAAGGEGSQAADEEAPAPRLFAALEEPAAPAVPLPEEPPGWEAQHYVLTLRGRDALNPMTELWMRFRTNYGAPGQHLLEVLADGASLEAVAAALDTPLEELRPWLARLEDEGFVRVGTARRR